MMLANFSITPSVDVNEALAAHRRHQPVCQNQIFFVSKGNKDSENLNGNLEHNSEAPARPLPAAAWGWGPRCMQGAAVMNGRNPLARYAPGSTGASRRQPIQRAEWLRAAAQLLPDEDAPIPPSRAMYRGYSLLLHPKLQPWHHSSR